jgi:hypothetical protein
MLTYADVRCRWLDDARCVHSDMHEYLTQFRSRQVCRRPVKPACTKEKGLMHQKNSNGSEVVAVFAIPPPFFLFPFALPLAKLLFIFCYYQSTSTGGGDGHVGVWHSESQCHEAQARHSGVLIPLYIP